MYAVDTDLYLIFKPSELTEYVAEIERAPCLVSRWTAANELKMNDVKTEVYDASSSILSLFGVGASLHLHFGISIFRRPPASLFHVLISTSSSVFLSTWPNQLSLYFLTYVYYICPGS